MSVVFRFQDYKKYLEYQFDNARDHERGVRSAFARHIGCQSAFVSRVMHLPNAHLSLEQAMSANEFFEHPPVDSEMFIVLVSIARAGTPKLRRYYEQKRLALIDDRNNQEKRFKNTARTLNPVRQSRYYSSWLYAAIHVLCAVGTLKNSREIATHLKSTEAEVVPIINFLLESGLIENNAKGELAMTESRLHLGRSSHLLTQHHSNWRLRAIESYRSYLSDPGKNLHYSSVVSVSFEDIEKIKSLLLTTMDEFNTIVSDSNAETGYCFNLDFFNF